MANFMEYIYNWKLATQNIMPIHWRKFVKEEEFLLGNSNNNNSVLVNAFNNGGSGNNGTNVIGSMMGKNGSTQKKA